MTTQKGQIRIGHFENFKGEDSILISVDINGLLELEGLFLKLAGGLTEFDFSNLTSLDNKFKLQLQAYNDKDNVGLRQTKPKTYEWKVSKEKWGVFREKITGLRMNVVSGHQYLDSDSVDNDDLQVIISLNEYPLTFWLKHKIGF